MKPPPNELNPPPKELNPLLKELKPLLKPNGLLKPLIVLIPMLPMKLFDLNLELPNPTGLLPNTNALLKYCAKNLSFLTWRFKLRKNIDEVPQPRKLEP